MVGLATDRAGIGLQPDSRNKYIHSVILYSGGQAVRRLRHLRQLMIIIMLVSRGFHMNYELF